MRRFVTYLYEYDKGKRGKNCGFVRIDVREGEVQMEVHMRNCLRCGEKGTIYILVEENDEIFGIEVGTIAVSNGREERTLSFREKNIEESEFEFDEIIGIGIRCENGAYFASNWEDEDYEALTWGNFPIVHSQKRPPSSEDVRPMPIPSEMENEIMFPRTETQIQVPMKDTNETISPMLSNQKHINFMPSQPQSIELIENEKLYQENPNFIQSEKATENVSHMSMPLSPEDIETNQTQDTATMSCSNIEKENTNMQQYDESETEIDNNCESQQKEMQNISKSQKPWWYAQMEALLENEIFSESPSTKPSYREIPNIQPADCFVQTPMEQPTTKICSYQKITVSDIRNLPSPNWYLCNNNFLLHGFFNYDYLVIKKEKSENREKFYLGVPGVFEKQEKAMAMMFGFPFFETCSPEEFDTQQEFEQKEKPKEPQEGDFGCWYLVLNL